MSHHPKVPRHSLILDASTLADIVVDLEPGAMQGMRTEQKGFDDVVIEIVSNQEALGENSGVLNSDVRRLHRLNHDIARIDEILPAVVKLHELLTETRASVDDERQRLVRSVAVVVEARAKSTRDTSLLARYQKTREYRSAAGVKAAKTRIKNAAAAEAQETMITEAVEKALAAQNLQTEE